MPKRPAQAKQQSFLRILAVLVTFIIPALLLLAGVLLTYKNVIFQKKTEVGRIEVEQRLVPSQVLNNKPKYNQQRIAVRGKVWMEPVVCSRQECPAADPCCGCPDERSLLISDAGVVLSQTSGGRMRMIGQEGQVFCQRQEGSCEYDCGDWIDGAIYDVWGTFFADAPPPGWKLSLEYYFQAEGKEFVSRIALGEKFQTFFKEIKERISGLRTSGHYILR